MRTQDERRREALKYLIIARQADADPAVGLVYQKGLEDIEADLVERVCEVLGKTPREDYRSALPELGAIRARCEALAREDAALAATAKLLPMPEGRHDEPTYHCLVCFDESSGWREYWCVGGGTAADRVSLSPRQTLTHHVERTYCGRKLIHGPHSYVERCQCYATNPVIARRRDASAHRKLAAADVHGHE